MLCSDRAYYWVCFLIKGYKTAAHLRTSWCQGQQGGAIRPVHGKYSTGFSGGRDLTAVECTSISCVSCSRMSGGQGFERGMGAPLLLVSVIRPFVDHASLPRRSTVPTPDGHLQHSLEHYALSKQNRETACFLYPLPVLPCVATIHALIS